MPQLVGVLEEQVEEELVEEEQVEEEQKYHVWTIIWKSGVRSLLCTAHALRDSCVTAGHYFTPH